MKFKYDENEGITVVSTETTDICALCNNFDDCPLVQALSINLVYPKANKLTIEECPMFDLQLFA